MAETLIKNFTEISKRDTEIAGGKGASLGEMTQAGIPVPSGFVILAEAFDKFLEETDLNVEIDAVLDEVDIKEVHTVENASEKIQAIVLSKEIPKDIKAEILKFYQKLDCKFVAVRSSATSEDSASEAWSGQLESFLNTTEESLLENVKKCWASLFTPRAIFYRFEKKLNKDKISVAVVVQKMVNSEKSGIAFSVHPVTQDENQIIIEAGFGLGEAIVSGSITPDSYVIDKQGFNILDINVNEQAKALYRKTKGGNEWENLGEKGNKQVLSETEIVELSKLIVKIENHYGFPCDIEWAKEKGNFYIVQSRPITTLIKNPKTIPVYEKVFTRDFSLSMLEVWYKGEAYDPKPWSNKKQPYLPYIIFVREEGTVKSYYDSRGVEWIQNHIKKYAKKDKNFLSLLGKQVKEKLKSIQPIYDNEKTLSKKDLLKFIDDFETAYPWVEAMWWLCEMSEKDIGVDISNIKKIREETNKLSTGTDIVVRKSLEKLFPKIKDYVHVLTIDEIKTEKIPSVEILKKRDSGFIYTQNNLYVGIKREEIEKKFHIKFENEEVEYTKKFSGIVAEKGNVRGKVRRVMGHKDISKIKEGEILVSPMTMPDFMSAMKKASAFVTDEGSLTCHAAIVAREMKKPCIVGTKIATQLLKDGMEIEVDANKGIVKIIKK